MRFLTAMLLFVSAGGASAQSPQEWVEAGHRAAREDRHADAIASYERALSLDAALRPELLASLGRQYLWLDQAERAAALLGEYLEHRSDCDVRSDYGLALSWDDRLSSAARELQTVIRDCEAAANTARLRLALVRRWQDLPSAAERLYREVLASGDAELAPHARLGLAHVQLQRGYERAARDSFEVLAALPGADARAAREGMAVAQARLGDLSAADSLVQSEPRPLSRDLREIRDLIAFNRSIHVSPTARAFRDADGTAYESAGISVSAPLGLNGRAGAGVAESRLSSGAARIDGTQLFGTAEYRMSSSLGARGQLAWNRYGAWRPWSGELHAIVTPRDGLRIDAAAARLLVTDALSALDNRLHGGFLSLGADVRLSHALMFTAGADVTRWSTDNTRIRVRAAPRLQLEGRPRITIELPVLAQFYDEPMPFAWFAPERYVEVGPGVNAYLRFARKWNTSLYGRAGAQQETGSSWNPFGTVRAALWRDVGSGWTLGAAASWSNSNLASPGSFRRTALELNVTRSF